MPTLSPKSILGAAAAVASMAIAPTASAQRTEGDANSQLVQYGRMLSEPGTFWLDSNDDVEVIRYSTPRDVSLCLPRPQGVNAAERGYPLQITWDDRYQVVLRPGNCFYFDAMKVKVKPAAALPSGVTLQGQFRTAR